MENNQNAVTQTETVETGDKTGVSGEQPVEKNEKTYTQEEVNALDKKLKEKYEKKYAGIDLKKYKEWEESQKTDSQKQQEILKENETLKKQLAYAENKSVVANAGVDSKFQKFVLSEVSEMEGDFEDNLKDYLKENPQYLTKKEVEVGNKTDGISTKKITNNAETGVTAILKAKHPDINF